MIYYKKKQDCGLFYTIVDMSNQEQGNGYMDNVTLWIKQLIAGNQVHVFYNSPVWKKKKRQILKDQHHECQRCKKKGIYKKARTVHHKQYLRKRPDLALCDYNLEAICDECHYDEHHRKKPGFINEERW